MDKETSLSPRNIKEDSQLHIPMECYRLVGEFFKGDKKKTNLWFETRNPLLGNISPDEMLELGRGWKLLKFLQAQLDGNNP